MTARRLVAGTLLVIGVLRPAPPASAQGTGYSLRFYGHGLLDTDSVKIPIDAPARPVDVASDFTLEWWMKANLGENGASACTTGGDNWIAGNIMFDRDIFGSGDFGDYGVSLRGGRIAFGVDVGGNGNGICGASSVADGVWHHVALTRDSSAGTLRIFVDGQLNGSGSGPPGDMSYRNGRSTAYPNSDPFLMIGEEKHFGPSAYNGWIDEVRLSTTVRYSATFTPPLVPFVPDGQTAALYHFDEGPAGACNGAVLDSSGASGGPSNGTCQFGGSNPAGPVYTTDTPLGPPGAPTPTRTATQSPTVAGSAAATATPTGTPSPTPTLGCMSGVLVQKPRFRVSRNLDPAGDENILLRGEITVAPAIDPLATGLRLRVDDSNGTPIFSRVVSPAGWTVNGSGNRWTFRDREGSAAGGVTAVTINDRSARSPGLYTFRITGRQNAFQVTPAQAPVRLLVVLGDGSSQCGTGSFQPASGPPPACKFSTSGSVLNCR